MIDNLIASFIEHKDIFFYMFIGLIISLIL